MAWPSVRSTRWWPSPTRPEAPTDQHQHRSQECPVESLPGQRHRQPSPSAAGSSRRTRSPAARGRRGAGDRGLLGGSPPRPSRRTATPRSCARPARGAGAGAGLGHHHHDHVVLRVRRHPRGPLLAVDLGRAGLAADLTWSSGKPMIFQASVPPWACPAVPRRRSRIALRHFTCPTFGGIRLITCRSGRRWPWPPAARRACRRWRARRSARQLHGCDDGVALADRSPPRHRAVEVALEAELVREELQEAAGPGPGLVGILQ